MRLSEVEIGRKCYIKNLGEVTKLESVKSIDRGARFMQIELDGKSYSIQSNPEVTLIHLDMEQYAKMFSEGLLNGNEYANCQEFYD